MTPLIATLTHLKLARQHAGEANTKVYADELLIEIDRAIAGCEDDIVLEARKQNIRPFKKVEMVA